MVQPVNGIAVICAWVPCSKPFMAFPSAVKRHAKLYCSRPCADLGKAQARTTRVTLICDNPACGKVFTAFAHTMNRPSKFRCCSRSCKSTVLGMQRFPGTFEDKFWSQVAKGAPDACWPWQGRTGREDGYGRIYVPETQIDTGTHIVAFYFAHGRWPSPGMYVCHRCDFPPCCNEAHLWEGTALENAQDSNMKGRHPHGERHHNSKLTDEQATELIHLSTVEGWSQRRLAKRYGIGKSSVASRLKQAK